MKIGFTGTQKGMTDKQKEKLRDILSRQIYPNHNIEFHHGDCIGADSEAHKIAKEMGFVVHIHPPIKPNKRAFCQGDVEHIKKDYLIRDYDIIDAATILIACPAGKEELRSGTWATVRYARKISRPITIIMP